MHVSQGHWMLSIVCRVKVMQGDSAVKLIVLNIIYGYSIFVGSRDNRCGVVVSDCRIGWDLKTGAAFHNQQYAFLRMKSEQRKVIIKLLEKQQNSH